MKRFWFLLIYISVISWINAQSTITIGTGSSISVGASSYLEAGYRDGTMLDNGYFNSRTITFDPVATAATTITQSSFFANWNASAGANGYRLDVSAVSDFSSFVSGYQNLDVGSVLSFNVNSNLSAGTTYYYRLRAYDIDGITGYSNIITVVTAPSNPIVAAAANINDISFSANWGSVTGATGYYLDVATTSDFTAGTFVAGFENKDVGNVVTFSITGLTGNTNYYYRLRARNASGTSSNSNTITTLTAPAAPNAIAASPIIQTGFTAKWRVSLGATKYYLDVSTVSNFASYVTGYQNLDVGSDTTFSVSSNIVSGTTYYYRVRASNGTNTSTNSNTISLITVPPNPVVEAATDILSTSFTANWNAAAGASKYYLDVSSDENFGSFVTDYENKDVGSVITFSVNTNLSGGVTYYYRIRANNSGGTSGNSGTAMVFTIPLAPVATSANPIEQTSFSANWNASVGATKYYLDVATDNSFINKVTDWNNVDVGNVTTYPVNTNLTSGTTYYYRVIANNVTGTSLNSNTITVTTVPPTPTSTAATNVTDASFYANWNFTNSATGYRLDVSGQLDFSSRIAGYDDLDVGNLTTYQVTGLIENTTYYYRVRAYNASGTSESSGTITQITAPDVPTANAAASITQTSFDASWSAPAGATGYKLDVATNSDFTSGTFVTGYQDFDVGNVTTYSVNTNLLEGTTYYYRVRSYSANGTSSSSNTITLTTTPGNPVATTATSIAATSFDANWNTVSGAAGYRLDVSTNSGFTAGNFVSGYENKDVGNEVTSSVNMNLTAGTTYYYRIRAYNSGGTSGNSGSVTVITVPSSTTANAATSVGSTNFTSNWDAASEASGYYLDVATDNGFSSFVSGFNNKDVGDVVSYIVTGLSSGTSYYYRIRSYNLSGTGANSNTQNVVTIPPAPSASSASTITATSFFANWNAATGVTGYRLDVSTNSNFTAGNFVAGFEDLNVNNVTTYQVTGLTAGSNYYYRVSSYNASGTSGNSNTVNTVTIPPAPVEQAATSITENSFDANWNASTGAAGYYLDVATNNDFSSPVPGYNGKNVGNVISYSVTALTGNTSYYYRIRAYNTGGTSENSGIINLTTAVGIPQAPAVTPATVITTTSFSANWNASSGAAGYELDVSTASDFSTFVGTYNDLDVGAVATYSVTGLTEGTTYYYRLRAYNGSGTSGNSSTITVITIPLAPAAQAASSIAETNFDANWNSSAGATGYYLDVATDDGFTSYVSGFQNRDVANVTTYTVTGLTGGTSYHYRIRAYNTGGTSGNSGTINPTTAAGSSIIATAATSILSTSFNANWNAYGGATGYKLSVSTASDFSSFVGIYNDLDVLAVQTYSVTGLTAGTTYYYRVKAYDGGGDISTSGTINVLTLPVAPEATSATSLAETNFTANWNSSVSATGYYIDAATDIGFTSFIAGFNNKYVNNVNSYLITGLTSGTNYYYRIRAKNGSGTGDNSGTITALTLPHAPTAVSATAISHNSFSSNWNSSTGAAGYRLDVSTVSNFASYVPGFNNLDVSDVTNYSVTGLSSGTVYYYRVRAYNGSGTSENSGTISLLTLPSVPVEAAASSITKISFDANWNTSTGAEKYYLDVATTNTFNAGTFVSGYQNLDVGNVIQYSITGLNAGTNYYYRVRAFNTSGTNGNSGTTTVLTIPPDPVILSASAIQTTNFNANWNSSTSADKYYLDVSTASDFSSFVAGYNNLDVNNVTTYSVTGLSGSTNYYYRVRANNASGTSGNSGSMIVLTAPAVPTATAASEVGETNLNANWNSSAGADGYKLDVAADAGFTSFVSGFNNKDVGNVTAFPVTGLSGGITYHYRIRAYSGSRTSESSNAISTLTKPAAPVSAAASSIAETNFSANWTASTGATKYYLDVATNSSFTSFVAGFNNLDVGNVTTYSVTSLSANTNYYYRIRAFNATGTSNNSTTITVLTAPPVPTTLAETNIANSSFRANWNASTGAVKYYLDVSTISDFSSFVGIYNNRDLGNVTTYSISGLSGNTTYYYRLRAYNGSGTSGNSGPDNVTTALDPSGVPTATAASSIAETSFSANWNAVAGASGYKLDVSTDFDFNAGTFVTNYNDRDVGDVTTFSVTGLNNGITYYYRLRSYNISGASSNSGTITVLTLPDEPVATAASSLTSTSFSANWNSVPDITEYHIDVATDAGFTSMLPAYDNLNVSNVTTYSITSLSGGTTYYYRVRAYNGSGASGNSNTTSALTVSAAPISIAATNPLETGFESNWNSVPGASSYRLDVSTNSGFTAGTFITGYENKDVGNVATYSVTGLTAGSTYYYRVRSYNASGTSGNSGTITALTLPAAPVATSASAVTGTTFSANWNAVTGVSKYYLDVSTDIGFGAGTFLTGYQDKDVSNVLTYSITGLTVNTNYYYRVRAYNSAGTSTNSNIITVLTAPLPPVSAEATSSGETSFSANWNSSVGATGYRLDVSTNNGFGAGTFESGYEDLDVGNVTTYNVTGITSGYTHYYRVRAYNSGGTSTNSGTIKVLGVPSAAQATAITVTSFSANWNSVTNVLGYRLDVATTIDFTAGTFHPGFENKDVGNVTTFPISGLTPNTTYYYRIRSYDAGGVSGNSNTILVRNRPNPPVAVAATNIGNTNFMANWNASAGGAAGYKLDVVTDAGFSNYIAGYQDKVVYNVTSFAIDNLAPGTTYYYRVRGYNSLGDSENSNSISVLTTPAVPVAIAASEVSQTNFRVNWQSSDGGADGYRVDIAVNLNFTNCLLGYNSYDAGNSTSLLLTNILEPGSNYYYRVRSYNGSGESNNSNIVSVITVSATPVAIAASSISQTSFIANWNAVNNASGYFIDVASDAEFTNFVSGYSNTGVGNDTTHLVTGLTSNTTYYYRIRSGNSSGVSFNSNVVSLKTKTKSPVADSASSITQTSFVANWNAPDGGADGYKIDVATDFEFTNYVSGYENIEMGKVSSLQVSKNILAGSIYYYRVRAINISGMSENSNTISVVTIPANPVAIAASDIQKNSFKANWQISPNADSYLIDISTDSVFKNILGGYNDKNVGNSTSFLISNLVKNKNYYYRIRSVNKSGISGYSNIISTSTLPNTPPILNDIENDPLHYIVKGDGLKLTGTIQISDVDDTDIQNAIISISGNYQKGEDKLLFDNQNDITGLWNDNTGVMSLSGKAKLSDYVNAIRNVNYLNAFLNTTKTNRVISFRVFDGLDNSNSVTREIEIRKINSAPVLSMTESDTVIFKKGSDSINISQSIDVTDEDNLYLFSGKVHVENNYVPGEDVLEFSPSDNVKGEFDESSGILSFSGKGKISEYENVLRSVNYSNTKGVFAKTSSKTISFFVSDGIAVSNISSRIIDIISPVLPPGGLHVSNDSNANIILTWLDISDNEDGFIINRECLSTTGEEENKLFSDSVGMNSTSYIDSTTTEADGYRYSIQSYMLNGAVSDLIPNNQKNIRAGIKKPVELEATAVPSGIIELKWKDCSNVEETFNIERAENSNDKFIKLAQVDKNLFHYNDSTIVNGTKYFYRVSAQKDTLISDFSNIFEITAIVTDVYDETTGIPTDYIIYQNYPNPFNPNTTIKYGLPKPGYVKLVLYNILGEELTTLVNAEQNAGYHKIQFNAAQYSSGIYFCKINSEKFSKVIKMLLVK